MLAVPSGHLHKKMPTQLSKEGEKEARGWETGTEDTREKVGLAVSRDKGRPGPIREGGGELAPQAHALMAASFCSAFEQR